MTRFNISFRHALATALALVASTAFAQSGGDFGGSFESNSPPATVVPPAGGQQPAPAGGSDFGGSFGPSDGTVPQPPPPPPAPPAPPPPPIAPEPSKPAQPVSPPPDGLAQIEAFELRDFGVPPTSALRSGQFHAPTPTTIPGGFVVTTNALSQALSSGQQVVVIDVLGNDYSLPGAYMATALASGGDFNDRIQQQAGQWLSQITGGNAQQAIVIYCSDPNCWLSYNATLRTIAAGYTNVYWYRGGLQAWQMAGLQLFPSGF